MIAQERLYFTSDRRRVVEHGNRDAAFLLVAPGAEIMTSYVPLVEAFYAAQAAKKQGKPEPLPDNTHAEVSTAPPELSADATEDYEKRIPTTVRRRGRPPKASRFSGDPGD